MIKWTKRGGVAHRLEQDAHNVLVDSSILSAPTRFEHMCDKFAPLQRPSRASFGFDRYTTFETKIKGVRLYPCKLGFNPVRVVGIGTWFCRYQHNNVTSLRCTDGVVIYNLCDQR
jgi:hypothetical protein